MKIRTLSIASLAMTLVSIADAQSFFDDFNRPNSGSLGANWTQQWNNAIGVVENKAYSVNGDYSWASVNSISNPIGTYTLSVDARTDGQNDGRVAVQMGRAGNNGMQSITFSLIAFAVQNNGAPGFWGSYSFSSGNNYNVGGYLMGGGNHLHVFAYRTARLTMSMVGADLTVEIDGDINGSIDDTFFATVDPTMMAMLGTGVGMGVMGTNRAGDFTLFAVPEPATSVVLGLGVATLVLRGRRK